MINLSQMKFSSLSKKSGAVFIMRIFGMLLSYIAIIFISNQYGAETYGRYALSQTLLQLLILLFGLGLSSATVKLTADHGFFDKGQPLNQYLKKTIILLMLSSSTGGLLLFILKDWLALTVFKDVELLIYFRYISFFIVFSIFHIFLSEFIRGRQKFITYGAFMYILPYLLFIIFLIIFNKLEFDESATILSYLLSTSLLGIVLLFYFPFKKLNTKINYSYKHLLSFSFPMLFSAAFLFISNWTDVFMLGAMVSKAEVGIYNAAYKLATIALLVINAVNTVLAPKISELYANDRPGLIQKEVQKATKLITLATLPILTMIIIFRKWLLGLFGEEFVSGENVLIVISIGLLFNALSGSVGQVLNMTNHQKELRNFTIITVVMNIVLNYILIRNVGILGAAIASLVTNIILNIMCVFYIKRKFGFYAFLKL